MHTRQPRTDYTSIDLSSHALAAFRSQSISHSRAIDTVNALLDVRECPRHQVEQAKYQGVLYPADALGLLEYSKSCGWPAGSTADDAISAYLLNWCETHQRLTPHDYAKRILAVCQELKCLDNAYDRLNLLALAPQDPDRITIATKAGSVTTVSEQRIMSPATKERIRQFLLKQHHFYPDLSVLYNRLEAWNRTCTLEASLIGWICSLLLKSIAEREPRPLQLVGDELFLAD